jgi:hypothetical protein
LLGRRQHQDAETAWRRGPAGVGERGAFAFGHPRNLGGLIVSVLNIPAGGPVTKTQALAAERSGPPGSERRSAWAVLPSEGNEATEDGQ